jgi:hypothetical protein
VNWTKVTGNTSLYIIISVIVIAGFILVNTAITGFAVYSITTIENNTIDGEGLIFPNGTYGYWFFTGWRYNVTKLNDSVDEIILRIDNNLIWDFVINTTYNETNAAMMDLIAYLKYTYTGGDIDIAILNQSSRSWVQIHVLEYSANYEKININLNRSVHNISDFINSTGKIQLLFNDTDASGGGGLYIDYLAINVTISPLSDNFVNLTNSTNFLNITNARNWTRTDTVNVTAHWNASSVSIVDGALVLNDSNTGLVRTFNVSESSWYSGAGDFAGNYTNFSMDFSNTSMFSVAGNYSVWMKSWDSFYQQNTSTDRAWLALWGFASLSGTMTNETNDQTLAGSQVKLYCRVLDSNSSWQVRGYNVTFYNDTDYIGWNLTNASGWAEVTFTAAPTNSSITCNITDQDGIYYDASAYDNESFTVSTVNDNTPPIVNSVRFKARTDFTNKSSLYENLSIIVNATDSPINQTAIGSVTVNVSYPSGDYVVQSMNQNGSSSDIWFIYFNATNENMPINQTGEYSVYVTAYDKAGNSKKANWTSIDNTNFTGYNDYTVIIDGWINSSTGYNRGEGVTLYARDVNGHVVHNLNWTVQITKYDDTIDYYSPNETTNMTFYLLPGDPVGNWTVNIVNVTDAIHGANNFSGNISFQVSNTLYPYFIYPLYHNRLFGLSSQISSSDIKARVNFSRNVTIDYNISLNFSYPSGSITKIFSREGSTMTHSNLSAWSIYSPGSYSSGFLLYLYASDAFNNSGNTELRMRTLSEPDDDSGGGGGGGGGGGAPTCECTAWENIDCGPTGGCEEGYMYQTRTCDPTGCGNESQCIRARVCDLIKAFNMTTSQKDIDLPSGDNKTLTVTLVNTGQADLELNISIEKSCCEVPFMQKYINLTAESSTDLLIKLHSKLTETPGYHNVTLKARIGSLEKSIAFNIRIIRNQLLLDVDELDSEVNQLESRLSEFESAGLWTWNLGDALESARSNLRDANESIKADKASSASDSKNTASLSIGNVKTQIIILEAAMVALEYRWWILLAVIIILAAYYMIFRVALPLHRLSREIGSLTGREKEMVKKRKEIEIQYFQGKLNQKAFNDMLIGEQGKILGARGKAATKIGERKRLIKERLSPKGVLLWLVSGPVWVIRKIFKVVDKIKPPKKGKKEEEKTPKESKPEEKTESSENSENKS